MDLAISQERKKFEAIPWNDEEEAWNLVATFVRRRELLLVFIDFWSDFQYLFCLILWPIEMK